MLQKKTKIQQKIEVVKVEREKKLTKTRTRPLSFIFNGRLFCISPTTTTKTSNTKQQRIYKYFVIVTKAS